MLNIRGVYQFEKGKKMTVHSLESQSLWYRYKAEVWPQESPQAATVHNIMRTLRALRNVRKLAYVSVPITSGKYLYDLKDQYRGATETPNLVEMAIAHNYQQGWKFVETLSKRLSFPILYPADLTPIHQEWEQTHFQALWLSIIGEMCTELHMTEGWEYSNGGSEEFTHVIQLQLGIPQHQQLVFFNTKESEEANRLRMKSIRIYDHVGRELTLDDGIDMVGRAVCELVARGFSVPKLEHCVRTLCAARGMLASGFYQ